MTTYSRWKNARPYDCKINDVEMMRFILLVATIPAWLVYAWALVFAESARLVSRGHALRALACALLTPFLILGELPSYLRSRWLNTTG